MSHNIPIVVLTSNISSIAIPIIENLINKEFNIKGIVCSLDNLPSHKKYSTKWFKNLLSEFNSLNLLYEFYEIIVLGYFDRKKDRAYSKKARLNTSAPLNHINTIDDISLRYGIRVFYVAKINSEEAQEILTTLKPELGITLACKILKRNILQIPTLGFINLHSMSLPSFKGLSPIGFRETLAGLSYASLHVHFLEEALDSGPIVSTTHINIKKANYNLRLIEAESRYKSIKIVEDALNLIGKGFKGVKQEIDLESRVYKMPNTQERLQFAIKKKYLKRLK
jgi:folate-dependent phosphoribosylglycinamide formyltransferase PurN